MSATRLPLAYLVTCSEMSLESVELSRLNRAANLRKEFHQILEEWVDSEVDARLARSLLEWKREQESDDAPRIENTPAPVRFQQLAIAFLPESTAPSTHAEPEGNSQLPPTTGRTKRVAHGERARSTARVRTIDHAMAPCRSAQRGMGAEARLREVEQFAESLAARLREERRKCATNDTHSLSCHEPLARPRKVCLRTSRPIVEGRVGAIEFVPVCEERGESESPPQSTGAEHSQARRILRGPLDKFQTKATRSGRPTPGAIPRPAECPSVHFCVRQAV